MTFTRTWPYGTVKHVRVEDSHPYFIACVEDGANDDEAYLLVGRYPDVKTGDHGYITFTEGGPTGGYWQFTKTST